MAKTVKIMNGYRVAVDGEIKEFREHNWDDVMDYLNIPKEKELRMDLFREFFGFGFLDLSKAYDGHTVIISVIPVDDRAYYEELLEERKQTIKERDEIQKKIDEIQKQLDKIQKGA